MERRYSIIVPIYKIEQYITQCIESIIHQTYKNIEIILVDDGSYDNCPVICDEYALKDDRIKVIHKENGGLVSARKAGALEATGDYICCVDGDDYIAENYIEEFEKKINDLEFTRVIAIQSAPQVRMLQNNDRELLDKLQSSLSNTIPLWRNQLVLSLGIERSKRALDAQSTLTEKTNELLRRNSETLKMATIETAEEVEKPIVDIETLRLCSKNLITSVNEVMKIHEAGSVQRVKAQEELIKIEEDLKKAMLESKFRK